MAPWEVQPLGRPHDRSSFDCGNPALNAWLQQRAGQWQKKELARCYVLLREGESRVFGYYTISSHHVEYEALSPDQSKGIPKVDVPVVLLGRLAVDNRVRGRGLGSLLLIDALRRAEMVAGQLGVRAVEVHAIDDAARGFYTKFGFRSLKDDRNHLFLPMHVIRKLDLPPTHDSGLTRGS